MQNYEWGEAKAAGRREYCFTLKKMIRARDSVGVCASSCSVGRPRKRWADIVKECLRERGLDVRQTRRMVQDRCECRGFVRGGIHEA